MAPRAPVRPLPQMDLFGRSDSRLEKAFTKFHEANPHVYSMLHDLAVGYMLKGRRVSIGFLYEVTRHERFKTHGDWFKLNNNFRSRYARMLMEREPRLKGFFHVRELTG